MQKYDVVIIGAGPAGLMAARELKNNKINFIIIDSKKEIGLPLRCGEGIREKEFLQFFKHKNYSFVKNTVSCQEVHYKDLIRTFQSNFLELDRPEFEQWLASPVRKHLRLRTSCEDINIKNNYIEIITNKRSITSSLAILSYGCNFRIQKKLNLVKKDPIIILGYGGICKYHSLDPKKFYYFFDENHLGYLWVFPKDKEKANIGFGAFDSNKHTKTIFNRLLKKFKLNVKQISEYAGTVPCSGPINKTYTDRLLICGNAAGQVHAGTGEGIYYALKSGKLAAQTAIKAVKKNKFHKRFLKQYEKTWKKDFNKSMQGGIIFKNLLTLGFKYKKIKKLFNAPSEKELKNMILEGKIPLRARIAWNLTKYFNLLNKEKFPLTIKILFRLYKFLKIPKIIKNQG